MHISIDVRVDGEEISGQAADGLGHRKPFSGWLGLIGALDALLGHASTNGNEPAVRMCLAFATTEQAEAFASSVELGDAIRGAGVRATPEIWFTHQDHR